MAAQLRDYLDLDVESARKQWASLARRRLPLEGERQVDFLPIETLTCFGLGLIAAPSPSGTINLRQTDPLVKRFARLFKRSEKSLAAKLNNLDGRRPHAARYETELWVALTEGSDAFLILYTVMMQAAREAGLTSEDVPDYLGVETQQFQLVMESFDVAVHDIDESALAAMAEQELGRLDGLTERAAVGTARIGQQQFARRVLENANYACAFCGLSTQRHGMPSARMLVASHIMPWRVSSSADRRNPLNGIAACPTHDAAFENFLIRVDQSGRIHRSRTVEAAVQRDPSWERLFGPDTLADSLLLADDAPLPKPRFVDWHWAEAIRLQIEYAT